MKKSLKICIFAALFTAFALVSCSNNIEGFETSDRMLSLTTFNAKMTDDLAFKGKRFQKMRTVLAENSSDILCIQDLYGQNKKGVKVIDEVRNMLKNDYGYDYALYAKTSNEDEDLEYTAAQTIPASCTMEDLSPIISCVMTNCSDYDAACIVQNCWQSFLELSGECRNCMLGNGVEAIANGNYQEILETCLQDTRIPAKRLEYEFSGNSGVLLASKLPMSNKTPVKLRSYGRMRTAVAANVEKDGIGRIQIICTGLSPVTETDYDGFGESWEDEQLTQIGQILEIPVQEDVVQRIILGDFDGNLAAGNIRENNPAPIALLEENGWYDPYFDVEPKEELDCTRCPENPLVSDEAPESVPDHIFFLEKKGYEFSSERIFLNEFTDFDKEHQTKTSYSVSDHYGITTVMSVENK
jgi:endonuclease/exonuclease/phosphatase family metal-dependent hydrolase